MKHVGGKLISTWKNDHGHLVDVREFGMYDEKGKNMKLIYKGKFDPQVAVTFLFKWGYTQQETGSV